MTFGHSFNITSRGYDAMRLVATVIALILVSGVTGSGITMRYSSILHRKAIVNSSLFMQYSAPPVTPHESQETVNALTVEELTGLKQSEQASADDRKALHDEIYKVGTTEVNHFNTLSTRMDVDEAKFSSVGVILGVAFTGLQGIAVFAQLFSLRERRNERKQTKSDSGSAA